MYLFFGKSAYYEKYLFAAIFQQKPCLYKMEIQGGSILWLEFTRCKLGKTRQCCDYDEVSLNHELNGQ